MICDRCRLDENMYLTLECEREKFLRERDEARSDLQVLKAQLQAAVSERDAECAKCPGARRGAEARRDLQLKTERERDELLTALKELSKASSDEVTPRIVGPNTIHAEEYLRYCAAQEKARLLLEAKP